MKKFSVLLFLACLTVIFLLSSGTLASARPGIYDDWTIRYPFSQSDDNLLNAQGDVCQLCHQDVGGGAPYNPYGWAIKQRLNAGDTNQQAFAAVEPLNSDNDTCGFTDLQEIIAGTQPGWRVGSNLVYDRNGNTSSATAPSGVPLDPPCTTTTTTSSTTTSSTSNTTTTTTIPTTTTTTTSTSTTTTTVPPTTTTTTIPTGQATVTISVLNQNTNAPITGASVRIRNDSRFRTETDTEGKAVFLAVPFGTYEIIADARGYSKKIQILTVENSSVSATVKLSSSK